MENSHGWIFRAHVPPLLTAQSAMAASISLSPTSNGGYINQWTSSGAFANWVNVADAACDGLTDFNQTSAVGNIDAYKVDFRPS